MFGMVNLLNNLKNRMDGKIMKLHISENEIFNYITEYLLLNDYTWEYQKESKYDIWSIYRNETVLIINKETKALSIKSMEMLTEQEIKTTLKSPKGYFTKDFNWLAKDKDGAFYIYTDMPHKKYDSWISKTVGYERIYIDIPEYDFISFEDNYPFPIPRRFTSEFPVGVFDTSVRDIKNSKGYLGNYTPMEPVVEVFQYLGDNRASLIDFGGVYINEYNQPSLKNGKLIQENDYIVKSENRYDVMCGETFNTKYRKLD